MGGVFIHAHRRGEHAAAHIRNAARLERALNGAVLAALAVEHGERYIDLELACALLGDLDKTAPRTLAATRQKRHRLHIVALPGTGDDILNIARVVQPCAIPRDADENRAKPVARKLRDDVVCRFERYIVFGGNAAEDDRNVDHEAPSSAHAARRRTE